MTMKGKPCGVSSYAWRTTTFSCSSLASASAAKRNRSTVHLSDEAVDRRSFAAYFVLSLRCSTAKTSAVPPPPKSSSMRYAVPSNGSIWRPSKPHYPRQEKLCLDEEFSPPSSAKKGAGWSLTIDSSSLAALPVQGRRDLVI